MTKQILCIVTLAGGLALAAWMGGACRQPSPAVPTEVEIDWPDAAPIIMDAPPADAGLSD